MSAVAKDTFIAPSLHLYKCDGGAPWVFAESVKAARKELANSDYEDIAASASIVELPGDESFGIVFDGVPKGLTADCDHPVDDVYGECV